MKVVVTGGKIDHGKVWGSCDLQSGQRIVNLYSGNSEIKAREFADAAVKTLHLAEVKFEFIQDVDEEEK